MCACLLVAAEPVAAAEEEKAEDGWVQLFNGKDLTGWKTHPDDKAKWEVVDGTLVGSGPSGHLFSERGDYENFHFRIEAKINDKGNSGQYFRQLRQGVSARLRGTDQLDERRPNSYGKSLPRPTRLRR